MGNRLITTLLAVALVAALSAQSNLRPVELSGRVEAGGKGIPAVGVTDGFNIAVTDHKGRYTLHSNRSAEFVSVILPDGYDIPLTDDIPQLYRRIDSAGGRTQRMDFALRRSAEAGGRHVSIVIADPQVYEDTDMELMGRVVEDVRGLVAEKYDGTPVQGIICGDIIGEISTDKHFFSRVSSALAATGVPFFYAAGNHDLDMDIARSDETARRTFKEHFGPTYYSFNRGGVHYVVLDDVFFHGRGYVGYIGERQLNWLEQDLALVPSGSLVVLSMHIPTYSAHAAKGNWRDEELNKIVTNRSRLYEILEPYRVHIMSGHEHYNENYQVRDNIFEHVHATVSGLFWQSYWCMDGAPSGYAVYEFEGGELRHWYYKPVGYGAEYQFNAYDVGRNHQKPDAVTANVWNWDPQWSVLWYEDGVCRGPMERYRGYDPTIDSDVEANRERFRYQYIGAAPTEHMFFAVPEREGSHIKIEVTDRFGTRYVRESPFGDQTPPCAAGYKR